jgi:adenine-specific DNA-methyltransferase
MANKKVKKANLTSSDLSTEKQAELQRILPEVFSEDKIDWEKLRTVLGDKVDERMEKFNFTWAGKSKAIKNVLVPSKLTLKPAQKESVKWDESENLFIEGDNLEVLKLLQKAYFEKVKMIYIDPPYNTGHDFVYNDDFNSPLDSYLKQTGQKNGDGDSTTTNKETNGRYHSDWLSMMYPRLKLAWNLLREDGVIFISIGEDEIHHLRIIMNEVFGEENFIGEIIVRSNPRGSQEPYGISSEHEYIICYAKFESGKYSITGQDRNSEDEEFSYITKNGKRSRLLGLRKRGGDWRRSDRPNMYFPFFVNSKTKEVSLVKNSQDDIEVLPVRPEGEESRWTWGQKTAQERISELVAKKITRKGEVVFDIYRIDLIEKEDGGLKKEKLKSIFEDKAFNYQSARQYFKLMFGSSEIFDFPKPPELIQKLLSSLDDKNGIIMDFFGGSGTTAHAVLAQNKRDKGNRKFIVVQLPEKLNEKSEGYKAGYKTIADIAKERIRRVIKGYGDKPEAIEAGFKVFKLDKSNYVENNFELDSEKSDEENSKAFQVYLNKAKEQGLFGEANDLDVVYENIVKEGLSLNAKITKEKIGKTEVYKVVDGDRELLICLEEKINSETAKLLSDKALKGKVFICLDNALDDSMKANLALNLELKTI